VTCKCWGANEWSHVNGQTCKRPRRWSSSRIGFPAPLCRRCRSCQSPRWGTGGASLGSLAPWLVGEIPSRPIPETEADAFRQVLPLLTVGIAAACQSCDGPGHEQCHQESPLHGNPPFADKIGLGAPRRPARFTDGNVHKVRRGRFQRRFDAVNSRERHRPMRGAVLTEPSGTARSPHRSAPSPSLP
jgi:hypothetical protein